MEYVMRDGKGNRTGSIMLFGDVTNCSELRRLVLEGSLEVCLIRASLVVDLFQVQCAMARVLAKKRLKTKSMLSEVLYVLGPTGNIRDSLTQMGAQDGDSAVIVVRLDDPEDKHLKMLLERIKGRQLPLETIPQFTDSDAVVKLFKVTESELSAGSLLDAVVTRIALKDEV